MIEQLNDNLRVSKANLLLYHVREFVTEMSFYSDQPFAEAIAVICLAYKSALFLP